MSGRFLYVEGKDDLHVIGNLWKVWGGEDKYFLIKQQQGIETLLTAMEVILSPRKGSDTQIGFVVDADEDAQNSWTRIKDRLKNFEYQGIPELMPKEGLVVDTHIQRPKVGVWIWPDNQSRGILEDFLRSMVPEHDELWEKADSVLNEISVLGMQRFSEVALPKALIHTWLAWQETPGKPYGQSISAKYFDLSAAEAFHQWLIRLFSPAP
ncbi:MAG: DUF3226 domain-containing protein [Bacteroidota bacterium]